MKTPNYNYTSVDPIIVERIRRRCEELNYELAFTTLLSCHPDDDYQVDDQVTPSFTHNTADAIGVVIDAVIEFGIEPAKETASFLVMFS